MTWGYCRRPTPLHTADVETSDALGRSKLMRVQTWAWLIGMSDADDAALLQRAQSSAKPPAVEIQGARLDAEPYSSERRAIRLVAEQKIVTIRIEPDVACVNPVFEISNTPKRLASVRLADRLLDAKRYVWDGKTLWLSATITNATPLRLDFVD